MQQLIHSDIHQFGKNDKRYYFNVAVLIRNLFWKLLINFGAWLSPVRAPGSGPGGRWFKSTRPDNGIYSIHTLQQVKKSILYRSNK